MVDNNPALQIIHNPEAGERLRQLQDNMIWIAAHREKLRKKYPDEYIAVDHGDVVAHGKELIDLKNKLKSKYANFDHVAVDFIGKEEVELILVSMR